jgi:hypothetical protein
LKEKYGNRTYFGIETIRDPDTFQLKYVPLEFIKYYEECFNYINKNKKFFSEAEVNNFQKIILEIKSGTIKEKKDFLRKVMELNEDLLKIKKRDFFTIFPEYKKIVSSQKKYFTVNNNIKLFL